MKLNSTVALTLLLLSSMFAVGAITGTWGYSFGRKALRGITQPALSPVLGGTTSQSKPRQGATFLREEDILKQVKKRTSTIVTSSDVAKA